MKKINIEKRAAEQIARLRKLTRDLPPGKARQLSNACDRLTSLTRKGQAIMDSPVGYLFPRPTNARYDARTQDDMAALADAKKAVFQAMLGGRKVSLKDSQEFRTSQMHTTIAKIRQDIDRKDLPYILCDEWTEDNGRHFKQYWITPKSN